MATAVTSRITTMEPGRAHAARAALGALLAVVVLGGLASPSAASTSPASPAPSQEALGQALTAALATKALPKHLTPSLEQLSENPYRQAGATADVRKSCDPYTYPSEARTPTPCWFGATSTSDPVIVIFGDSFVGNWMPALSLAARQLGYRVAGFEFKGCYTADVTSTKAVGFSQSQANACNTWHRTLPPAVRRLRPKVIIAANGTPSWMVKQSAWVRGMQVVFHDMNPTGASTDILLGTGVHLVTSAPICLASNPADIQGCTLHYKADSATQIAFTRDELVAKSVPHLHLITTSQWVCTKDACPTVVAGIVVYSDWDHLTIAYSDYLSHLFFEALHKLVPASSRSGKRDTAGEPSTAPAA